MAGWPAIALLVAIKLLAGLLDSRTAHGSPNADQYAPAGPVPAPANELAIRRNRTPRQTGPRPSAPRSRTADVDLVAAARTAQTELATAGERLNGQSLTRALRRSGHAVSNARAGELLTILRDTAAAPVNGARPGLATFDGGERDA